MFWIFFILGMILLIISLIIIVFDYKCEEYLTSGEINPIILKKESVSAFCNIPSTDQKRVIGKHFIIGLLVGTLTVFVISLFFTSIVSNIMSMASTTASSYQGSHFNRF